MESQMVRPHGHTHEQDLYKAQDPHYLGGEEEHHEKKSVLNKVKAKAKKIKDTITKHGHGHNDHDRVPDNHDLDEEDDEDDEESVEDPEVHGAPIHDSAKVTTTTAKPANTPLTSFSDRGIPESVDHPSKTFVTGTDQPRKVNSERPIIGRGLVEDPHAPTARQTPSNYQTKVTDPTGTASEEVGITPILRSFNKMNIDEEFSPGPTGTGSHDRFSPGPVNAAPAPSYTDKISAATSAIADKAISAKNAVASKIGYGATSAEKPAAVGTDDKKASSAAVISKEQGSDKGVSAKAYWAEKLRPGEEERALSEAISEALYKRKQPGAEEEAISGQHYHPGRGYVDKVKGTVGSWLGFGASAGADQSKPLKSQGEEEVGNVGEERRLQESSN